MAFIKSLLVGGFLKWCYPTTMGFPTKNDHFEVFGGYHLKDTPKSSSAKTQNTAQRVASSCHFRLATKKNNAVKMATKSNRRASV